MSETKIARLNHNKYASDIRELLQARAIKKEAEAKARKADEVIKNLQSALFLAMDGAPAAKCGNAVITIKPGRINPGALTLKDGRSIPLSDITDIVIAKGHDVIQAEQVAKWFGGSRISDSLEITLTEETV